jgi:hypothetical protein
MVLYGVTGKALELDMEVWRQLLAAASLRGWKPLGTAAPPRSVFPTLAESCPWTGSYDQPAGQEVTRKDAAALADNLRGILNTAEPRNILLLPTIKNLLDLCRHGGFVICEGTAVPATREPVSATHFTSSIASLSQNLGTSVSPRPDSPLTGETAEDTAPLSADRASSSKK